MKKWLSIIFIVLMVASIAVGCSAKKDTVNNNQENSGTTNNNQSGTNNQADDQGPISTGDKKVDDELSNLDKDINQIFANDGDLDKELNSLNK